MIRSPKNSKGRTVRTCPALTPLAGACDDSLSAAWLHSYSSPSTTILSKKTPREGADLDRGGPLSLAPCGSTARIFYHKWANLKRRIRHWERNAKAPTRVETQERVNSSLYLKPERIRPIQRWSGYRCPERGRSSQPFLSTVTFSMEAVGIVRSPQPCSMISPFFSPAICGTMTLQSFRSETNHPTERQ